MTPEGRQVLEEILHGLTGAPGELVVFDLDGTLIDNRRRTLAILRDFCAIHDLPAVELHHVTFLVERTLARAGVPDSAFAPAARFWTARFFADTALSHDTAYAGAVEFVTAAWQRGANVVYLTGRDRPRMALGTVESLLRLGFPLLVPGAALIMKPDPDADDVDFKRGVFADLTRSGVPLAFFDNDPRQCNAFLEAYPAAQCVHVNTGAPPDVPSLDPRSKTISDFSAFLE